MKTQLTPKDIIKQQKQLEKAMDEVREVIPSEHLSSDLEDPDAQMIEDDEEEAEEEKQEPETKSEDTPSFSEKYYDDIDRKHAEILQKCAVICRSDKTGFTDQTRLDAIREILKDSPYQETYTGHASMWTRAEIDPTKEVILISSHADTVQAIKKPFSELSEDGYYKGTYDNIGTNAAAVIAMLEANLPGNVVFAFTSEEETGRFKGIKSAVATLEEIGVRNPICIALDVTYDGYDNGSLYTIENGSKDKEFLNRLKDAAFASEPQSQTFTFVRKSKKAVPDDLDEKYISSDFGDCDEAFGYNDMGLRTCSICLPSDGYMHSDSGLTVRQPVFEGYTTSLQCMVYALTNTHKELLEAKTIEKQTLSDRCQELIKEEKKKPKYNYTNYSSYYGSGSESSWYDREMSAYHRLRQEDYEDAWEYQRTHGYSNPYGSYEGLDDADALAEELTDEYRDDAVNQSYEYMDGYASFQNGKEDKKAFVNEMMQTFFPALDSLYRSMKEQFKMVYEDAMEIYKQEHDADQEEDYEDGTYGGYVDDLEDI